jgi:lysozyme
MKASGNAIALIKEFEGCRYRAYDCPAGVCTIGYGHTEGVYSGMTISQDDADRFLAQDIEKVEKAINQSILVKLNQNQFDALVSFVFNIGISAFYKSTLLQKLNLGAFRVIPYEMNRWCNIKGKFSKGLQNRRNREVALFQKDIVTENEH